MAMLALQKVLARIYIDADLRNSILNGSIDHADLDLTDNEAQSVYSFVHENHRSLEYFSGILVRKRVARLASEFKLASGLLGPKVWSQFCSEFLTGGTVLDWQDPKRVAVALSALEPWCSRAEFLALVALEANVAIVAKAAAPEARWVELDERSRLRLRPPAQLHELAFCPNALREWATSGADGDAIAKPTKLLLLRLPGAHAGVEIRLIRPLLASILSACDGRREVREIVTSLVDAGNIDLDAALAALSHYATLNLFDCDDS